MTLKEALEKNKNAYIEFHVHAGGKNYWADMDSLNKALLPIKADLKEYIDYQYTRYTNFPFLPPKLKKEKGEELLKKIEEIENEEKRKLLKFLFNSDIYSYSPFEQLLEGFHHRTGVYTADGYELRWGNINPFENYRIELIELPDRIAEVVHKRYILKITFPPKREICDEIGRTNIYYFALMVDDKSLFDKLYEIYAEKGEIQDALLEIVKYFIPKESPAYEVVKLMEGLPNYKPTFIEIKKDGKFTVKDPFKTPNFLRHNYVLKNNLRWANEGYKIEKKGKNNINYYDEEIMRAWEELHKKPEEDDFSPRKFSKRRKRKK